MIYTVQLTTKEKEAILTALNEKLFSLPANSPARATYQQTIKSLKEQLTEQAKPY